MTHLFTVVNPEINKYIAKCSCGWESLTYNSWYGANLAGDSHLSDYSEDDE